VRADHCSELAKRGEERRVFRTVKISLMKSPSACKRLIKETTTCCANASQRTNSIRFVGKDSNCVGAALSNLQDRLLNLVLDLKVKRVKQYSPVLEKSEERPYCITISGRGTPTPTNNWR